MDLRIISILLVALFCATSFQVHAEEKISGHKILSTAKVAGSCGILDSMVHFQETTKMDGGDEFVSRFWAVEAARLGMSVQKMSEQCDKTVTLYDNLWKAMGPEPR